MLRADTIRVVFPLEYISKLNRELLISFEIKENNKQVSGKTSLFNNNIEIPKILGLNFKSIRINELKRTIVIEFSSKLLKERYIELININNIEYLISLINETNIFKIDTYNFIDYADVIIIHVANNIEVENEPQDYITDFFILRHNQKYSLESYQSGLVFKSKKYSGSHDNLKIYCKFIELVRRENSELSNFIDINSFKKIIKVESQFTERKKIFNQFGSIKLKTILCSNRNPNLEIFDRISNFSMSKLKFDTDINQILNSGKRLSIMEKMAGKIEICKYYNYDQDAIKYNYIPKFKGNKSKELKEYKNICNSVLTNNYCLDNLQGRINEFKEKLIL